MIPFFYNKKIICLIVLCFLLGNTYALENDTLKRKQLFEISFGQNLLFISNSKVVNIRNQSAVIIPTSSALFFVEFRPSKKLKVPVFFNLPIESKQFLVNGQLVNEKANPTLGSGLEFRMFQLKLDSKSKLELELGPLVSFITSEKGKLLIAPLAAGRFRITRGENFVMYIGSNYSFGVDALGLMFGTGTVF